MAVDDGRRRTAGQRRALVIETMSRELDLSNPHSATARIDGMLRQQPQRNLIVSGDIDGLVSASMLCAAAPAGWRTAALIIKSGHVLLHPYLAENLDPTVCFGVDVYSTYIDNVSNHVALWGGKRVAHSQEALEAAQAYDAEVRNRSQSTLLATPSLWAGIQGSYPEAGEQPDSAGYRYPLGTAQVLLGLLEACGRSPKMFDRDYLPWLVANCDGGLATFAKYPYNVPLWWSCLAASVGPASLSEAVYQTAATQAPVDFVNAVNRLRAESHLIESSPAQYLNDDWNLRSQGPESVAAVVRWVSSLSGWPDPFLDGAGNLSEWVQKPLPHRGSLRTTGLPQVEGGSLEERVEAFRGHFRESLRAVHTNFAFFDQTQRLNWVGAWDGANMSGVPEAPDALAATAGADEAELANAADSQVVI